ncbi:MAG: hypothetical protein ACTSUE_13410 [Promethearchaeota archaeon]
MHKEKLEKVSDGTDLLYPHALASINSICDGSGGFGGMGEQVGVWFVPSRGGLSRF